VIYTDDSSGGADDCNEGKNYQDVFSALEVLRQPSDYRNVDRYQAANTTLSQPSASLIRSTLDMDHCTPAEQVALTGPASWDYWR